MLLCLHSLVTYNGLCSVVTFYCHIQRLCNSYTMACPPVRGDNPRALASGLSYVQVDK